MHIGIQTKSNEVSHILKMVLEQKDFNVQLLSPKEKDYDKFKLLFLDQNELSNIEIDKDKTGIIVISDTSIGYDEIKQNQLIGYLKTPLSLELINSLAEDLEYHFNSKPKRASTRFPLSLKGTVHSENKNIEVEVLNLSHSGFKAVCINCQEIQTVENGYLNVQNENLILSVPFSIRWSSETDNSVTFGALMKDVNQDSSRKILDFVALQTGLYLLPE